MHHASALFLAAALALAGCVTTEEEITLAPPSPAPELGAATIVMPERPLSAPAEIAAAVAATAQYDFGQDREPLTVVEDMSAAALRDEDTRRALAAELTALLNNPQATYAAKDFACRQLWLVASEEDAAAIAPLLHNPETANIARYALERVPGKAVDDALIGALAETTGDARIGIMNTLGERRAQRAKKTLDDLTRDADPATAEAARAALGKIDS